MNKMAFLKYKIQTHMVIAVYHFRHWVFAWTVDTEDDLVFSVCNVIHFIKYKEHTVIEFGRKKYKAAPKYVGEQK